MGHSREEGVEEILDVGVGEDGGGGDVGAGGELGKVCGGEVEDEAAFEREI